MNRMMLVGGLVVVGLCGGCASAVKKVDVNKGLDPASPSLCRAGSYYNQQRSVDLLTVRGNEEKSMNVKKQQSRNIFHRFSGVLRAGRGALY